MNRELEKQIKDFVNGIFIRGEKEAIEFAATFIEDRERKAFEAGRELKYINEVAKVERYKDYESYKQQSNVQEKR